jgi:histidinol-phosphatase
VSDADRDAEAALRARIAEACPGDGIVGEEFGERAGRGSTGRRWILDPIDGTKNFVRGIPVWASLIALERDGDLAVGVVSAPALARRWWAVRGGGAWADGTPLQVSAVSDLGDAMLSYDSLVGFEKHGLGDAALALERRCWRTRGLGDFWSHVLVAEGAVDVAVEPEVELYDVAPLLVIVEEAGGRFTDLRGTRTAAGGTALSTNGLLHHAALDVLRGVPADGR